ncbi:MAG: hypothetical protein BGO77_04890 [Caedibacter sp. 37-49]|nr:MAG: hypothetical protein BGO77_04890 [Caedibacter sp. 37-49]
MRLLLLTIVLAISFSSSVSAVVDAETLGKIKQAFKNSETYYENKGYPLRWLEKWRGSTTPEKARLLRKHDSTNALKDVSDEDIKEGIEVLLVGNKKEKLK